MAKERVEQKDPEILEALAQNFKTLVYKDADLRAAEAEKFFNEVLKIAHVKVLRNLSREEIIEVIKQLEREAAEFENSKDYDSQAVNVIFVNWIGFSLHESTHKFM